MEKEEYQWVYEQCGSAIYCRDSTGRYVSEAMCADEYVAECFVNILNAARNTEQIYINPTQ